MKENRLASLPPRKARFPLRPVVWVPLKAPRSSGVNGAKSCILADILY